MKFGGTDRRRLAMVGALIGAFVAVAVAFGVVQASATPGAGIVGGPIVARGLYGREDGIKGRRITCGASQGCRCADLARRRGWEHAAGIAVVA